MEEKEDQEADVLPRCIMILHSAALLLRSE
jgi:hypothetical protein